MYSTSSLPHHQRQALEGGALYFFPKPIIFSGYRQLIEVVRGMLEQRKCYRGEQP